MSADPWIVWTWNPIQNSWYEVGSGTGKEASHILAVKRAAAARIMPSDRFTATPKGVIPQAAPDDIDREIAEEYGPATAEQVGLRVREVLGEWLPGRTYYPAEDGRPQRRVGIAVLGETYADIVVEGAPGEPDKEFTVTWRVTERPLKEGS